MNPGDILAQRRAQLARLNPLKAEHRERAKELRDALSGIKEEAKDRAEERDITEGHPLDLFPTPPDLAARMVDIAQPRGAILEPSAGTGNILRAIGQPAYFVELNYSAAQLLIKRGYTGKQGDFMEYHGQADTIIMNPPFSADIDHVMHAYEILNPGGRIVAIMSEGVFYRSDKKSASFRDWLKDKGYTEELDAGTFKASGTMVKSRIVVINRPPAGL